MARRTITPARKTRKSESNGKAQKPPELPYGPNGLTFRITPLWHFAKFMLPDIGFYAIEDSIRGPNPDWFDVVDGWIVENTTSKDNAKPDEVTYLRICPIPEGMAVYKWTTDGDVREVSHYWIGTVDAIDEMRMYEQTIKLAADHALKLINELPNHHWDDWETHRLDQASFLDRRIKEGTVCTAAGAATSKGVQA